MQCVFCWLSALAVYLAARFLFGIEPTGSAARFVAAFLFVQASVYGIGFLIASAVPNVKTANLVCTLVYFPTLFLSGATVPYEIMPKGLQIFSNVFPLTQGIKILKGAVLGLDLGADLLRFVVLGGIGVVSYAIALLCFRWE
jgi:ABC-2 type transport system permease protein